VVAVACAVVVVVAVGVSVGVAVAVQVKRRWRQDGPDYHTGCQMVSQVNGLTRGAGGLVRWMHDSLWEAMAWTRHNDRELQRGFKRLESAKRAVEQWLDRQGTKGMDADAPAR